MAQADSGHAELRVIVTNEKSRKLSNVSITVKNVESGIRDSMKTGLSSTHTFILNPGKYELKVTLEGFIP